MENTTDQRIDDLARRQLGLVDRATLLANGVSDRGIKHRVAGGRLIIVQEGVYRTFGTEPSWRQAVVAACLAAGPGAVASHRAAALIWGLITDAGPVEITVPLAQSPTPRRTRLHRSTDLAEHHVTTRFSIPITKPARTVVDLGAVAPYEVVREASEVAVVRGLASVAAQRAMLDAVARRGRRGCGVLRAVLDNRALGTSKSASVSESFFARLVQEFGGEKVQYQVEVLIGGERRFLDFAIPDAVLGIEIDSEEFQGTLTARTHDRQRTNSLATVGYLILRYGSIELKRSPKRVLDEIATVAAQRRSVLCRSLSA